MSAFETNILSPLIAVAENQLKGQHNYLTLTEVNGEKQLESTDKKTEATALKILSEQFTSDTPHSIGDQIKQKYAEFEGRYKASPFHRKFKTAIVKLQMHLESHRDNIAFKIMVVLNYLLPYFFQSPEKALKEKLDCVKSMQTFVEEQYNHLKTAAFKDDEVDVVIVGGGPGGLALASQIIEFSSLSLKLNRKPNVVIFEKYQEYQRHHVLHLEKNSFDGFPTTPVIQEVVNGFFDDDKKIKTPSKSSSETANVKTSTIENNFKKLTTDQEIKFIYETIDDPKAIQKRFPNVKVIIGTDGSKSELRKQLFTQKMYLHENELQAIVRHLQRQDPSISLEAIKAIADANNIEIKSEELVHLDTTLELLEGLQKRHALMPAKEFFDMALRRMAHEVVPNQKDLQYIAEVKYEVKGVTTPVNIVGGYSTHVENETIISENIGKQVDGITPITLRAFIGKEDFLVLQDKATFKHPLKIDDPAIPEKTVKKAFDAWMQLRGEGRDISIISKHIDNVENVVDRQNVKLTVTRLQNYHSNDVVKEIDNCVYAICCDAQGGVPFFRNFNGIGLPSTSILAQAVVNHLEHPQPKVATSPPPKKFKKQPQNVRIDFAYYTKRHRELVAKEERTAELKNTGINAYKTWLHTVKELKSTTYSISKSLEDSKSAALSVLSEEPESIKD